MEVVEKVILELFFLVFRMDSFVLAETFKYLYLLFSEDSEHAINIHDFIFTTEAHLLPLYLSTRQNARQTVKSSTVFSSLLAHMLCLM